MEVIQLKFLLKLLGQTDCRAPISKLQPSEKTSVSERDKICRQLTDKGIVSHSREIKKFKIEAAGKNLLSQDRSSLPFTEKHFLVLEACKEKSATPGEVKKLSSEERQNLIQELEEKGFIKAEKTRIKEVWLTDEGYEYLRDEHSLTGTSNISLNLLQNYINFLRKAFHNSSNLAPSGQLNASVPEPTLIGTHTAPSDSLSESNKPNDEDILQIIQDLDHQLGTENYLPIFHLRQKLQPPLSRDELDQALYRLQRQDKIDMSSLVEAIHYTSEQIQAGIPQDTGSPLFFIMLKREDSDSLLL
ncbi:hypothetical protein H6F93_14920 [Leptolyngbya sp. FACHB-671]|uniref:hypothetical protein n=1 Tax=Leptolyngbya sp. FACHB-671 TaxID=2692812 RepID=UPI00168901DD|nr:hypothetical protein [Leptolyngbya sp. FACHB-671]MBD2068800.1 hypothetical protein [Leptolyngbya sp. FACHB-671]